MPANELMQVNTSPSSDIKFVEEVNFLKKLNAARPDGLFLTFFEDGGRGLRQRLTELLGSVSEKGDS